ncbi:MAG TPA: sensor histidine kinase [Azospirillum sp.]|nr:sensor histidine kinase [Azospirillum sp.]
MTHDTGLPAPSAGPIDAPPDPAGREATLLRDFQHRVMNNLQFILSLLDMQARRSSSDEIRDAFRDLRVRIDVLAEVYRLLYRTAGETTLDIGAYVGLLAQNLSRFYDASAAVTLSVEVEAEPVRLDIDRAFPTGLVVTELVVNCFKHAFDGGRPGRIAVRVAQPSPGQLAVTVADNGPGLAPAADDGERRLGMTIVHALARQMGGSVDVRSGDGLSVTLSVPL